MSLGRRCDAASSGSGTDRCLGDTPCLACDAMRARAFLILWSLSICLVIWASLQPGLAPSSTHHMDKLAHLAIYALLAIPPALVLRRRTAVLAAGLLLALVGVGVELAQTVVPSRVGSSVDVGADLLGIALGLFFGIAARRIWRPRRGMT